jgi:undecaprenyl pyrophosphate phosphatase UppP
MTAVSRAIRAFGHFWLDFLIGDTPEIFVGALFVVAAALVFRHDRPIGIMLLVVLTVLVLVASTYRGRKYGATSKRPEGHSEPLA